MVGELITLPLRISTRAAETMLRAGVTVTGRTLDLASQLLKTVTSSAPEDSSSRTEPQRPTATDEPPPREEPRPRSTARPAVPDAQTPARQAPPEPPHVSEEPVVVEELAEPGAEDGAGANIEIAEPWKDYDQMTAKTIVARLRGSSAAELAVVELYESSNRNRETVLSAVKRELKTAGADGRTT